MTNDGFFRQHIRQKIRQQRVGAADGLPSYLIEVKQGPYGVALLCGFDTPSLAAQGGQRFPP